MRKMWISLVLTILLTGCQQTFTPVVPVDNGDTSDSPASESIGENSVITSAEYEIPVRSFVGSSE